MALLVSSWSNGVQSVPQDYVMPPERRPGDFIEVCKEILVIDLQNDRSEIIQQILKACQEFGLFQNYSPVINHGVSEELMAEIRVLYDEFFKMPIEDKSGLLSKTYGKGCTLHTSGINYAKEKVHFWKDTLKHDCHPLEKHSPSWPDNPVRYREEVGKYAIEVRKMGFKILNIIGEGLGLAEGCFDRVSQEQYMVVHLYPRCPDPSLAMGIDGHADPNIITFLQQDQYGLQIQKDGKWMGVEPIPNAFVVNLGYTLEIVSNEKLKSVEHRVVTNSTAARTSIVTFFSPSPTLPVENELPVFIESAKELVTASCPSVFKSFQYKDFVADYLTFMCKPRPRSGTPLDSYRL